MSKVEILAELPLLAAEERSQIFHRLCELQDDDLVRGPGPTLEEKRLLDHALAEFRRDGHRGKAWRECLGDLKSPGAR